MTYNVPLIFSPDNDIYKGHFPNNPITPGVCQIEAIRKECAKILKHDISIQYIQECKFVKPIIPNNNIYNCYIDISETEDCLWKIQSVISLNEDIYLKLKANLKSFDD